MILKQTTIVLGAGASMPYGLPSGAELRSIICKDQAWLAGELNDMHHIDSSETLDFIKNFSRSSVVSIDAFLSRHDRFVNLGKLCIATILCAKEDSAKVMDNDADDHWYQHMWQILIDGADTHNDLRRNKIKFITFNYDRSLEYFLHQSIKYTYGVNDQEALRVVRDFDILHVYGLLGEFSFTTTQGARHYTSENHAANIRTAAEGIKIIPEARDDEVAFDKARDWFYDSEIIGFLGFGFDTLNVERLGLSGVIDLRRSNNKNIPSVIASTYDKTDKEAKKILRLLWQKAPLLNTLKAYNHKNTMIIRESDLFD